MATYFPSAVYLLCFVIFDLLVLPERDFRLARLLLSLGAVGVLLFGFIWDREA